MQNPARKAKAAAVANPNATAAGGSTLTAATLIAILAWVGITMPLTVAVYVVAILPIVVLYVGRKGLRGVARQVWRGSEGDIVVTEAPVPVEAVTVEGEDAEEVS